MNSMGLVIGVIFVSLTVLSLNFFTVDFYDSNSVNNPSIDTSVFDKTREITESAQSIHTETKFLEDIPIVGDFVAIAGNAVRGMRFIFQIPGILISMIGEAAGIFVLGSFITDAISAIIWVFVIFTILYFMRGAKY